MLTKSFFIAWAWTLAHPALLWFSITFLVNLGFKDASAYIDAHPNLAVLKKLAQKYGISPRGTIALLYALATKNKAEAMSIIGGLVKSASAADEKT